MIYWSGDKSTNMAMQSSLSLSSAISTPVGRPSNSSVASAPSPLLAVVAQGVVEGTLAEWFSWGTVGGTLAG